MIFQSFASSSEGNAYLVCDEMTSVLIECGISYKALEEASGFKLTSLHGVLVSHEHNDHCRCVKRFLKNCVPVYLTQGTARALMESNKLSENLLDLATEMVSGEQFAVGTIDIMPFTTFHDALEPVGFVLKSRIDGDTVVFATDTVNLPYNFPGVNILAVEANFQKDILDRSTKLPDNKKHRVSNTHMEIDKLCECLRRMDLSRCREIYLLHLSSATSHEGQFIHKVERAVPAYIRVISCPK